MFTVEESVPIDRPAEVVFGFVSDPSTYPRWRGDVVAVDNVSPGPLVRGSTFDQIIASFLGRQRFTFEVTGYEPNGRLELRATSGPVRPIVTYGVESAGRGTRLTARIDVRTRGVLRLLEPLMTGAVKKRNSQDLSKLKQILEV
jgi:uncharacterized protein YndB with AHSA1/START domain